MTIDISNNAARVNYTVAQGATQTSFSVPFEFFNDADLSVYVDDVLKTITTHYTVSGGDGSTGTITMSVTGASGGSTVVISRSIAIERTSDFVTGVDINRAALNTQLDTLTAIAADNKDKASRSISAPNSEVNPQLELPDADTRKGKLVGFNETTGNVELSASIADGNTLASISGDIATLADIEDGTDATDAIQTVANISSDVTTVAGISANVTSVAGNSSNINTVAADEADIGTVAGSIASVNTNAANITDIQNASANAATATTKASEAATSATNAATSETNAATSETNAATSASTATTQAGISTTKATESAASAAAALASKGAASTSETNASTSATNSANSATASETSRVASVAAQAAAETAETNAETAETNAAASASAASTSASNASTSETNAASSAASASTDAATATTKAGEASTSASNAASSASSAQASSDAALSALDSFDDRYLGQKTADPTVDNDGDALVSGALYFNTTDDIMKVYDGSLWVAAYASLSGAMFGANNLSDVADTAGSRANLGLVIGTNVQAFSAILQNTTASYTTAEQTKLAGIETGATADQTASEIRSLVEAATDSNVFTDADHSKLDAVEANAKDDQTITAGSGLTGGGTGDVTLSHSDTSSQASVNNSGATVVQDVTLDTYGHVTGLGSHTLTLANLGYTGATNANYITNNNQLTNGAGYTTNVGDITNVTAGTNLTGGGSSGSVTVNLTASPNITSLNVGGSEVVSSSRALKNIASVDATTAAAIGAAGVGGGGTVDLTADGSISSGDVVGISGSGTVSTTAALFGPKTSFATANALYLSSSWDRSANKVVVASAQGTTLKVRVGTIASNGTITWGSEASYSHGDSPTNIGVAMHNNVVVATFQLGNYGSYLMMQSFGVSGTTISSTSGLQYLDGTNPYYGGGNNVQNLMADPNNSGKFVQAYTGGGGSKPRAACITATGSSCTSNTVQVTGSAGPSYFFQCLAYNPTSGKFMGTWVENNNIVTACRLEVSGSSISLGTPIITDLPQSNDQASMAYSSTNGNFLYFVRDGGRLYGWVINTASNGNASSFGGANLIYTGSGSDFQVRHTYNSSNSTTVGAWKMGDGGSNFLILKDTASGVISVDGDPIDISDSTTSSMNYGGPWGMQGKGSFVTYNGNNSPRDSSEINTASTYFTALGISEGNYTNGQTATITIPGGVTNTISGLTPGAYYKPSSGPGTGDLEGGGTFAQALDTNKLLLK